MKLSNKLFVPVMIALIGLVGLSSCNDDGGDMIDIPEYMVDETSEYMQKDQTARPAINTVFNTTEATKNAYNTTIPSMQSSYASAFQDRLLALNAGYTTNALGLDAATFTSVLATDVLTASTDGTTTFFDGTNVLTGRNLTDDVISVELLLIFGGPDGSENPGLTDDHVSMNDKSFSNTFPYLASPH